jgi:hypothetical protein
MESWQPFHRFRKENGEGFCMGNEQMMMALPKFIITMDGYFRLGMVNQHKDLLKPGDSCLGGGYYHFDYTSNRIVLDRSSYDFGKPKWYLLEVLKVPSVYRGLRLVYFYDDNREFDVSQELQIEYYD